MTSKKQVKANQKNAQKSTGPKTAEGKAAVSQNAVKHGIFAQSVIKGENEADYEAFHDKLLSEMNPVGTMETMLAERAVNLWWRLRRAERIQNQAIDVMIARDEPSPLSKRMHDILPKDLQEIDYDTRAAGPELVLGRSVIKDFSYSRVLDRMSMYERRIENSLLKIMRELERRQIIRQFQQQEAEQELPTQEPDRFRLAPNTAGGLITDLKKQSQLSVGHISANSLQKGDYDKSPDGGDVENKAKQTQIHAVEPSKGAPKSEKPVTSLTG
ncbi:MAG: hypothetical protein ACYSTT_05420 [Planctomycetota bacterium]|jgi:hypothetical protein